MFKRFNLQAKKTEEARRVAADDRARIREEGRQRRLKEEEEKKSKRQKKTEKNGRQRKNGGVCERREMRGGDWRTLSIKNLNL